MHSVTAPTSYAALVERAHVKKGDWVLVHAAAGGVGLAAVQVAKAFGATVVATAGTKRKLEVAKQFGADHVVDYREYTRLIVTGALHYFVREASWTCHWDIGGLGNNARLTVRRRR